MAEKILKKVLFINQQAPHGTAFAQEQLQMMMVFGAFEQNVSLLFSDEGVFSLLNHQQTDALGFQNFTKQYLSLEKFYDISQIYVDEHSLLQRALKVENLMMPVSVLNAEQVNELMHDQDMIFSV